ncbi:MAG TPA: DUF3108 domain-containing protein [Burkholderiaceae bacterium]|nr:DUF3108 domain-containing protein [Burkholderiaceae bacterium]
MLRLNQKHTTYGLGLIASVFVFVLLAHLTAIQAVIGGFFKVNANPSTVPSTALITRMIEPALQIEAIPAQLTPPKIRSKPPVQKPATQTVDSKIESKPEMPLSDESKSPVAVASEIGLNVANKQPDNSSIQNETAAITTATATMFNTPQTAKQIYDVTFTRNGNSNYGQAELNWQHDGVIYNLSLVASYFGMDIFEQKSQGITNTTGLQPVRFSDKRYRKSEVAAHFNHELGKITFSSNTPDAILLSGAQDRLSIIMQLAGMLAADPMRYGTGSTVNVQVASDKLAEPWIIAIENSETLTIGLEKSIARKVTRNPRREFDQKVELWFATEQNYAPVRFRFTETNGDFVDAILKSDRKMLVFP